MGSVEGVVEEIGIRSTRLRNPEGRLVTVPNHKFTDSLVENISAQPSLQRHLALTVPVAMSAGELERVEAALAAVARPVAVRMVGFAPAEVRYTATYELPAAAAPSPEGVHAALLERLLSLGVEGLRAE
jgi:small-conductance mechanosensitive channel